jgi:hypothetical protein
MFLNDYVNEEFFFKNGLPRGSAILNPIFAVASYSFLFFNNMLLINQHFDKQKSINQNFIKFFNLQYGKHILKNIIFNWFPELCGFREYHTTSNLLKSTLIEIWEKEYKKLDTISKNRFRGNDDINQWAIKNWQFMAGKFEPINPDYTKFINLSDDNSYIIKSIKNNSFKVLCINDGGMNYNFEKAKAEIIATFEEKFPQKCGYEL